MNPSSAVPAPPGVAQRFVRYLLGFGVSVAVGLAPFLGKLKVPLFEPLLDILPPSEHGSVVPLSAAIMGIVAIAVQWYAFHSLRKRILKILFVRMLVFALVALLLLYVVNTLVVTRVPVQQEDVAVLLHGFGPAKCMECVGISDGECIRLISFAPERIEGCWGSMSVRVARISLSLSYFAATATFGALVGLLVIGTGQKRPV